MQQFACDGHECRQEPHNITPSAACRFPQDKSDWDPTYFPSSQLTMCRVPINEGKGWSFVDRVYCVRCRRCRESIDGSQCSPYPKYWTIKGSRRVFEQCPFIHSEEESKLRPPGLAAGEIAELQKPTTIDTIVQKMASRALDYSILPRWLHLQIEVPRWDWCHWVYAGHYVGDSRLLLRPTSSSDKRCVSSEIWSTDPNAMSVHVSGRSYKRGESCEMYTCVWCKMKKPYCTMVERVILNASCCGQEGDYVYPNMSYLRAGEWMCRTCIDSVQTEFQKLSCQITSNGNFCSPMSDPSTATTTSTTVTTTQGNSNTSKGTTTVTTATTKAKSTTATAITTTTNIKPNHSSM